MLVKLFGGYRRYLRYPRETNAFGCFDFLTRRSAERYGNGFITCLDPALRYLDPVERMEFVPGKWFRRGKEGE